MQQKKPSPYELAKDAPEFYVDAVHVETQLYGSTLFLGVLRGANEPSLTKVVIKASPQLMKVLSLIISKHVSNYEENIGPIAIPKTIIHDLGLEELI